jgi:hypothetical protein
MPGTSPGRTIACLPRADDIPPIAVTLDPSAPCKTNPLGAKGCGESGTIGGPPCNDVMDALSELGVKKFNTPLTPAKKCGRRSRMRERRSESGCQSAAAFSISFSLKEDYNLCVC